MNKLLPSVIIIFLLCSCGEENFEKEYSTQVPQSTLSGDLCFKSNELYDSEFIHVSVNQKNIVGEIFTSDEYFGDVKYSFKGILVSDSIMEVQVHDVLNDPPITEKWKYHFHDSCLTFQNKIAEASSLEYKLIDCGDMPDVTSYGTVEDMESNNLGEKLENTFPKYYESVMSDPMKHWGGLHEYFQILEVLDTVIGVGIGISDGVPPWEFDFAGKIVADSIYLVNVNYRQEGHPSVSSQEKWVYDQQTGEFFLSGYNRPNEGRRYVSSEVDYFPAFIQDSLQNNYIRLQYHTVSPWDLYKK